LITFDRLLTETPVAHDLRRMLAVLEEAYEHPVDIEFALNFLPDGTYRIHCCNAARFRFAAKPAAVC
jgi:pyruvate, water dikinase